MIITLVLLIIFTISAVAYLWFELSITSDRVEWLSERLYKLEKDAVKVTFTGEPEYHGMRTTPADVERILNTPIKQPKQERVLGEWQTKNKTKSLIKRKPKTLKNREDEIDLGPKPIDKWI